jgi:hypothetical protein
MHPAAPLTPFQRKLTRLCLRINPTVVLPFLVFFWHILPISDWTLELISMHRFAASTPIWGSPIRILFLAFSDIAIFFWVMAADHYAVIMQNYLPGADLRDYPVRKYPRDLEVLASAGEPITALGFVECDRYYLDSRQPLIYIVYKHMEENLYWLTIRWNGRQTMTAIYSNFENDVVLQTATKKDLGKLGQSPLRARAYLQLTPMVSPQSLLETHREAVLLFNELGYTCQELEDGRQARVLNLQRYSSHLRTYSFWPIRMTLWMLFGSNAQYRKPLREQLAAGTATIPVR